LTIELSQYLPRLLEIELGILNSSTQSAYNNEQSFNVLHGTLPIIISAPHSGGMIRNGKSKSPETGTASIAVLLHEILDVSAIYTTGQGKLDPASVPNCDFKSELSCLVRCAPPLLVLDIHALHSLRSMDCDLGSMHGKSLRRRSFFSEILKERLLTSGMEAVTENIYPATGRWTITQWAFEREIPSLQCEVNSRWLFYPGVDQSHLKRFECLMSAFCDSISDFIKDC
jgi:hypothetical protein